MKIVFMGTPQIAVPAFEALAGRFGAAAAVCQPDKAVGRRQVVTPPPVKAAALNLGVPVYQPESVRRQNDFLFEIQPDIIVVMAYGKILPAEIIRLPKYGCVNLHASLLPRYRGAAPIQWALANGETQTGITAMRMDEGMDTGDIIRSFPIDISPQDDAVSLFERIAGLGGQVVCGVIEEVAAGAAAYTPQDPAKATYAPIIKREDALVDFAGMSAERIVNAARGFAVWPNAYFLCGGLEVKIIKAALAGDAGGAPGEIISTDPLKVAAAAGAVELKRVKPQGSREMTGTEFIAGRRLKKGSSLL